jgi:hypothetical protein
LKVGTGCIKSVLPALALPRSGSTVEDFSLPLSLVYPNSRVVTKSRLPLIDCQQS